MARREAQTEAGGPPADQVRQLLTYYYPMHYRIGMELETVMGQGKISRKQAAMLWLIHSRADADGWIRRKAIEMRLSTWFEISNSNISKLLRDLAKPPLSLITQVENPESGREKVIRLTKDGERFVEGMIQASVDYLSGQLIHVSERELGWGIAFLSLSFGSPPAVEAPRNTGRLPAPPARVARIAARGTRSG